MPRGPDYNPASELEARTATAFFADRGADALGVNMHAEGYLATNPDTGATYHVVPIAVGPQGQIDPPGSWAPGSQFPGLASLWTVLLDGVRSKAYLIASQDLGGVSTLAVPDLGRLARKILDLSADGGYSLYRGRALATDDRFCHLHVHSMYSFLDGVASPRQIAEQAAINGQQAIALTDHGYLFAAFKFYQACREVGVKPLIGCEFYLVDDVRVPYVDETDKPVRFEYHQTVLAMNQVGFHNLCLLATAACRDHFYHVPRIDWQMLAEHHQGLIVLSGCFKGAVAWHLQQFEPPRENQQQTLRVLEDGRKVPVYLYDPTRSFQVMKRCRDVFGDRYYCEVQPIDFDRYMQAVPQILEVARQLDVPVVVAGDCHYAKPEDAVLQAVCSRIGKGSVGDGLAAGQEHQGVYSIRQRSEMQHELFTSDMYDRTCEVADRVDLHIPAEGDDDFKYLFPAYDVKADADWADFNARKQADRDAFNVLKLSGQWEGAAQP